jgi:hypothetical protein
MPTTNHARPNGSPKTYTNMTENNPFAGIPRPAGAMRVCRWEDTETSRPYRYFVGSSWSVDMPGSGGELEIWIDGMQHHDGSVSRDIVVSDLDADHPLTLAQARQLAAVLIAAADEADELTGHDGSAVS